MSQTDRVLVFDTTLRDGEQAPGASMNLAQKLQVARALATLGVDIMEVGFPVASPGDFAAVQAGGAKKERPGVFALARGHPPGNHAPPPGPPPPPPQRRHL